MSLCVFNNNIIVHTCTYMHIYTHVTLVLVIIITKKYMYTMVTIHLINVIHPPNMIMLIELQHTTKHV